MSEFEKVERDLSEDENKILDEFHRAVFSILKICQKIEPNNVDVEFLRNKLTLAREIDPLLIMHRSMDKIWIYRNEILSRDTQFFVNNKFDKFVKDDENKTFMYTLINLIKKRFLERTEEEKKVIWDLINQLLISVIKYKKVTKDYKQ